MPMKVLISGYYGFGNLGDEALLSGLLSVLRSGGHTVTVLSDRPEATEGLHRVAAVSRLAGAPGALLRCDAFLSGGGGLLQDKTSFRSLQYYLTLLRLAKLLGKRTLIYGQSVGPLSERGRRLVKKTLRGVTVAVRDRPSQVLLESLSINSYLCADAALLLEPPQAPFSEERAAAETVLLIPRAGYPEITEALAETAQELRARGVKVAAAAVQPAEDAPALQALKEAVPDLELLHAATPGELLEHINGASYVVSGRLHGLILAAVAGRAFCGLVYDPKVAAFLDEAGAPAFTLPVDKVALLRCALARPPVPVARLTALKARAVAGAAYLLEQLST